MSQEPSNPIHQTKTWNGDEELGKLIGNNDELKAIYGKLGQVFLNDDTAHEQKAQIDELLSNSLWVRQVGGQDDAQWHHARHFRYLFWKQYPHQGAFFLVDHREYTYVKINARVTTTCLQYTTKYAV